MSNRADATTHEPAPEEIFEMYAEVDPGDVAEDAVDYFEGDPSTESERGAA